MHSSSLSPSQLDVDRMLLKNFPGVVVDMAASSSAPLSKLTHASARC